MGKLVGDFWGNRFIPTLEIGPVSYRSIGAEGEFRNPGFIRTLPLRIPLSAGLEQRINH